MKYPVGATVQVVIRVRLRNPDATDGDYLDLTGADVTVYDPDGAEIAEDAGLSYVSEGELLWRWNTAGLRKGTYKLDVEATVATTGESNITREAVELV